MRESRMLGSVRAKPNGPATRPTPVSASSALPMRSESVRRSEIFTKSPMRWAQQNCCRVPGHQLSARVGRSRERRALHRVRSTHP